MNTPKKIAAGLFLIALCFVLAAPTVFAEPLSYEPLVPLPHVSDQGAQGTSQLSKYVIGMFQLLIGIAAALAVIMIVIGGIEYMSTDAISGKSDGRKKIENALWGLALAISSYLILSTIDPYFLNSDIDVNQAPNQNQNTQHNQPSQDRGTRDYYGI